MKPVKHDDLEAIREEDHREWLRTHGYPVPPTDEELDEYWNSWETADDADEEPPA